jgi:hypothetical protein
LHISGRLGKGNLKQGNRETSFHYYPGTGVLSFSNQKYEQINIGPTTFLSDDKEAGDKPEEHEGRYDAEEEDAEEEEEGEASDTAGAQAT